MSSLSIRRSDLVVKEGWDEKKVLATLKEVGAVPGNAVVFVNLLEEMSQRKLLLMKEGEIETQGRGYKNAHISDGKYLVVITHKYHLRNGEDEGHQAGKDCCGRFITIIPWQEGMIFPY